MAQLTHASYYTMARLIHALDSDQDGTHSLPFTVYIPLVRSTANQHRCIGLVSQPYPTPASHARTTPASHARTTPTSHARTTPASHDASERAVSKHASMA
jgi:hypothetical protein